jgi:flagellar motor switch protein FliG
MKNRHQALRKAAILIASLDHDTADGLLDQMTAEQARAVRETIDSLGDVAHSEQQAVIEEFFRIGPLVPEKSPPGIELDSQLARHLGGRAASAGTYSTGAYSTTAFSTSARAPLAGRARYELPPSALPFHFLEETSSSALARYLQRERPQTIAVVVSHLTSDRGAEVLALLPAELQGEVTLRLVHLDKTDPEILDEIERGMQSWISQQPRSTRAPGAGLETLRGILAAADERSKSTILRNLAQHDRRLANKLAGSPRRSITFAELEQFDDVALANVLRHAPSEIVLLALAGAGNEFVRRVLALVPAEDAGQLRQRLGNLGPTRLSDVEQAQQELADVARQFEPAMLAGRDERKHLSIAV